MNKSKVIQVQKDLRCCTNTYLETKKRESEVKLQLLKLQAEMAELEVDLIGAYNE